VTLPDGSRNTETSPFSPCLPSLNSRFRALCVTIQVDQSPITMEWNRDQEMGRDKGEAEESSGKVIAEDAKEDKYDATENILPKPRRP
jgi:hypothetical protein